MRCADEVRRLAWRRCVATVRGECTSRVSTTTTLPSRVPIAKYWPQGEKAAHKGTVEASVRTALTKGELAERSKEDRERRKHEVEDAVNKVTEIERAAKESQEALAAKRAADASTVRNLHCTRHAACVHHAMQPHRQTS